MGTNIDINVDNQMIVNDVNTFKERISINLNKLCKQKKLTQNEIIQRCEDAGYHISQATISNAKQGKGNLTLSNLVAIAYALEVNLFELLDTSIEHGHKDLQILDDFQNNSQLLIRNPNSTFLQTYLGIYHTVFFKTSGARDDIIRGILEIKKSPDEKKCKVILQFGVDETNAITGEKAKKIYEGELVVSQSMRAVYCLLTNIQIGEMCMLVFQHIYTLNRGIDTMMAMAVTTASGSNRRPTAHRMAISRNPIEDDTIEYVKGQLLMNTADIYLNDEQLNLVTKDKNLPQSFKDIIYKVAGKNRCYCIPEAYLYDSSLSEMDLHKCVSLVRAKSMAPKYNKISRGTDEALFALLGNNHPNRTKNN